MSAETPFGWDAWEAWQAGTEYADLLDHIRRSIVEQRPLDLALSVEHLASCAFSAGLTAARPPDERAGGGA